MSRVALLLVSIVAACGGSLPHEAHPTRLEPLPRRSESPRLLGLVAAADDDATLSTIYSLCEWIRSTPSIRDGYSGIYIISSSPDPLTKVTREMRDLSKAQPAPPSPDNGGAPAADPTGADAAILHQIDSMLAGAHELAVRRAEVYRCWASPSPASSTTVELLILHHIVLEPYGAGVRYLLMSQTPERSRRNFVPLRKTSPRENSRFIAAAALADEDDLYGIKQTYTISPMYRCASASPKEHCMSQEGEAFVDISLLPTEFVRREEMALRDLPQWRVERDGAPDNDSMRASLSLLGNGTYRLKVRFTRAGHYLIRASATSSATNTDRPFTIALESRMGAMLRIPDTPVDLVGEPIQVGPRPRIDVGSVCRGLWLFGCDGPPSSYLQREIARGIKDYAIASLAETERAMSDVRGELARLDSPYVDDLGQQAWSTALSAVLTDDNLRLMLSNRTSPREWCTEIWQTAIQAADDAGSSPSLAGRSERWRSACQNTTGAAMGKLYGAHKPVTQYTMFADGGDRVYPDLQESTAIRVDGVDPSDLRSIDGDSGAPVDEALERAYLRMGAHDSGSEPVPLFIRRYRPLPLLSFAAQGVMNLPWCPSLLSGPRFYCLYFGYRLRAGIRLPFEIGSVSIETNHGRFYGLFSDQGFASGVEGRSYSASLAIHPWCYWSNTRGSVANACHPMPKVYPTVTASVEHGEWRFSVGLAVSNGGDVGPLTGIAELSLRLIRGSAGGFGAGGGIGF